MNHILFKYQGYTFMPYHMLKEEENPDSNIKLASFLHTYDWNSFYDASSESCELFWCIETGELCLPKRDGLYVYKPQQGYQTFAKVPILPFYGHHNESGKIERSCLSQWYPSDITYRGRTFFCAEQLMMAAKAMLFNDALTHDAILICRDPARIKRLGRVVQNFDQAEWDRIKINVVANVNYLKFRQNPELSEYLLSTGDSILVEASPYDPIWGAGLSVENPQIFDPLSWKGTNLLGFILMDVRDNLRS